MQIRAPSIDVDRQLSNTGTLTLYTSAPRIAITLITGEHSVTEELIESETSLEFSSSKRSTCFVHSKYTEDFEVQYSTC